MKYSDYYRKVYLASLTPVEILNFRINYNYHILENSCEENAYIDYLADTVGGTSREEAVRKYSKISGFTESDIRSMTSKIIDYQNDFDYPEWFEQFIEICRNIPGLDFFTSDKPFLQFFTPFLNYFSTKIISTLDFSVVTVHAESLSQQLRLALYDDLFELSKPVLFREFYTFKSEYVAFSDQAHSDNTIYKNYISYQYKDQFKTFFLKYPMLLRRILVKLQDYIRFIVLLFARLESDKSEIESEFNIKIQNLNKIHLNMGDQHNAGSTVIIEFEDQNKIIYKPCNVGITHAYNSFIAWINNKLLQKLKTFKIVNKNSYGWLQYVDYESCSDEGDIKDYFERAGILLGVAYLLNANDFHYENVIAAGNSPVLIDHETILSPKLRIIYPGAGDYSNTITGTVLETSLIPVEGLNLPYYGYGYGSSSMPPELPVRIPVVEYPNTDSMRLTLITATQSIVKQNKPALNGKIVSVSEYTDEFITGFSRMYNLILTEKEFLLSDQSPLRKFYNSSIRLINRQTKVYHKLLKLLNTPDYLSDAIRYGIKLEILAKAYLSSDKYSAVLKLEREQMLAGDIPAFYINTVDTEVDFLDKDIIDVSAFNNILQKIVKHSPEDYQRQASLINKSIAL